MKNIELYIRLYLHADLSDVADVSRLTEQEQVCLLTLLEKVCDYHAEEE